MTNRIRCLTRWPDDVDQRRELAEVDLEFCLAMGRILSPQFVAVVPKPLAPTWDAATKVLREIAARN